MTLTGTGRMVRLVLRRDRLRLPLWIGGIAIVVVASAASLPEVYADQAAIDAYAALVGGNLALVAFTGPGYGFDDPNIGIILVTEIQLYTMIAMAFMSIFLLNRHTRAEEDVERAELLRSNVVGRHAAPAAAVAVVAIANLLVAASCTAGFIALDYPTAGSIALGASLLAVGWMFLGVAAVTTQVSSSGRGAIGVASAVLLAAFVLRAVGDVGDNLLRWLSPIGWAQSVRAFAGEQWWTLGLCLGLTIVLVVVGFWLLSHRDLGSGLLPQRLGPVHARAALGRPLGLAVRLQLGMVVGWVAGMFLMGIALGSMGEDIGDLIDENPIWEELMLQAGSEALTDSFFATTMVMMGMISAGFSLAAVQRLRVEESAGRVESILATGTGRTSWVAGHVAVGAIGTVLVMGATGLGTGLAFAAASGDVDQIGRLVGAALATVPAILVLMAIGVALFGWRSPATAAAWGALAVVFIVGFLGDLLQLPEWAQQLSPFTHLPAVPAEPMSWTPIMVLLGATAVLTVVGLVGFRRRDIDTR